MITRVAACAALLFFLLTAFRSGWRREETDFPNYYTAAVLVHKGMPLREYYDWTWFARQMNYAGVEHTIGSYIPQTPLTMLPLVPLAGFEHQTAKRIWLIANLFFLAATIWFLAGVTRFRVEQIWLLTFFGFGSLYSNFLLGQYYVFLLFLLTLAFYFLCREKQIAAGFLTGAAFGLKLYGGPFLLYFAAKRQWRAVAGMLAAFVCLFASAVALFGWPDIHYFATQILPRAADGEVISPYHSGNNAYTVLLRRLFMSEPELNPHPLWNVPWLFFFLRPLVGLGVLAFTAVGIAAARDKSHRRDFAWFFIAMLLISPNISSYTTILLLLPLVLLLEDATRKQQIFVFACYVLLTLPTLTPWMWLFPKVWSLLVLFAVVGRDYLRPLAPRLTAAVAIAVIALAAVDARRHLASYAQEPVRHFEQIPAAASPVFAPVVTPTGIFYQSIGRNGYVLRRFRDDQIQDFEFVGEVLHPVASSSNGPIYFELVANKTSIVMEFDPSTGKAELAAQSAATTQSTADEQTDSAVSPDGQWQAFTSTRTGSNQVWLQNLPTGKAQQLTGGNCNSQSPAWELNSQSLLFTSDCGRGIGLPALYRAQITPPTTSPAR
jgi:Glycosyltransferase family 87/WD40-like Beta Propeller Repeat